MQLNSSSYIQDLNNLPKQNFTINNHPGFIDHLHRIGNLALVGQFREGDDIEAIKSVAMARFRKSIDEVVIEKGEVLKKYYQLKDFHLSMQQLLFSEIEKKIEQYLVNNPNDEIFIKKSKKFQKFCAFAIFENLNSNTDGKKIIFKIEKYLNYTKNQLRAFEPRSPEVVTDNQTWEIFEYILNKDLRLLQVPVSLLAGLESCDKDGVFNLMTSARPVFESYNFLIERLRKNLPWVLDFCEEKLVPYLSSTNLATKELAENLLVKLKIYRESFLPDISKAYFKNLNYNIQDAERLLKKLYNSQCNLFNSENFIPQSLREHSKLDALWKSCSFDCTFTYHAPIEEIHLELPLNKLKSLKNITVDFDGLDEKIAELEELIAFRRDFHHCQEIMAIYCKYTFAEACILFKELTDWSKLNQKKLLRKEKLNLKLYNSKKVVEHQVDIRKVEDLIRLIEGPKKKLKKSGRVEPSNSGKGQPLKSRSIRPDTKVMKQKTKEGKSQQNKVLENSQKGNVAKIKKTRPVEVEEKEIDVGLKNKAKSQLSLKVLQFWVTRINSASHKEERDIARQAYMYLEDTMAALEALRLSQGKQTKFYSILAIQSSYFYLEQLLQFIILMNKDNEILLSGRPHNLISLLAETSLEDSLSQKSINTINEFFSAYLWIRYPFEQIKRRKLFDIPIPPLLTTIHQIYKETRSIPRQIVGNIRNFGDRISSLTTSLLIASKWNKEFEESINPLEISTFNSLNSIDVNKYEDVIDECKELLVQVPIFLKPKLKQTICHLELLTQCLVELNHENISSEIFSLLVRTFIFWENAIFEELLQVAYELKTGILNSTHQLPELYATTMTNYDKKEEHIQFLSDKMENVHNVTRYPFSTIKGSTFARQLILGAEKLREYSDVCRINDFKKERKKRSVTKLNYQKVKKSLLDPQKIASELIENSDAIVELIKTKIFPEIHSLMENGS